MVTGNQSKGVKEPTLRFTPGQEYKPGMVGLAGDLGAGGACVGAVDIGVPGTVGLSLPAGTGRLVPAGSSSANTASDGRSGLGRMGSLGVELPTLYCGRGAVKGASTGGPGRSGGSHMRR